MRQLADPACYPNAPRAVTIVQTHISIVCLADELVFKLKKPVRLPFLDFSTLERRRTVCRDEVRLNRRLCPDVYLGTAALRRAGGALRFAAVGDDESADDLDVAVVMRRLPDERMLDQLLASGSVGVDEARQLAVTLADFHASCDRGARVRELGSPERLAALSSDNFAALRNAPESAVDRTLLAAVEAAAADAMVRQQPLLERRAAQGRVVDGHGDLHARNICMLSPPQIYDCLEFDAGLRCGDVANEVAFLCMDLRYRGASHLAQAFVDAYALASGDQELRQLLPTMVAYRAMVRCKVSAIAMTEAELGAAAQSAAQQSARRHLQLAAASLVEAGGVRWLVLCGPPGSGKSALAAMLHAVAAWPVVSTDLLRKELAGLGPTDRLGPEGYTADFSARTYGELLARARAATAAGASVVVLDGNFATPDMRSQAAAAARQAGAEPIVLWIDVPPSVGLERVRVRMADPERISDAGPEQHARLLARFVPPTPQEGNCLARVEGDRPPSACLDAALAALLRSSPRE